MAFRKLSARYFTFALPLVISVLMSCLVSGVSTYHSIGPVPEFFPTWMASWGFSWAVAFPVLLFVLPTARRIVFLFVEKPAGH